MTLRPLPGRVLVKPDPKPTLSASDIYLVQNETKTPSKAEWREGGLVVVGGETIENCGVVVALGHSDNPAVSVGERVLFSAIAGHAIEINRERYLSIRERDILAVVE